MKKVRYLNGYRVLYLPEHPRAMTSSNWEGYVYEHIVVAEDSLGRPLHDGEQVHHLDLTKWNNRKENLLVLLKSQHIKIHVWLEKIGIKAPTSLPPKGYFCKRCEFTLQNKQRGHCSTKCLSLSLRRVKRPSRRKLERLLGEGMNWSSLGRKYLVSDNAVRKWAKSYQIL